MQSPDYVRQLEWRSALSRLQHESERYCRSRGVTAPQYHVLLAIKACEAFTGPTVGRIAQLLSIVPSTAVGLVDRLVAQELAERSVDRWDARVVRMRLTAAGEELVHELAEWHRARLAELATTLASAVSAAVTTQTIEDLVQADELARDAGTDGPRLVVNDR
jgi:DNA-binding MarR family transcriptional regulator